MVIVDYSRSWICFSVAVVLRLCRPGGFSGGCGREFGWSYDGSIFRLQKGVACRLGVVRHSVHKDVETPLRWCLEALVTKNSGLD